MAHLQDATLFPTLRDGAVVDWNIGGEVDLGDGVEQSFSWTTESRARLGRLLNEVSAEVSRLAIEEGRVFGSNEPKPAASVTSGAASGHVDAFDTSLEKTYRWLHELADELGTGDRRQAYEVLRALLHALRDRLSVESAAKLGAQLPMLVRGFYYEGWNPAHKPEKVHLAGFLDHVRRETNLDPDQVETAVRAASRTLHRHVTSGEIAKILHTLPHDIFDVLVS